MKMVSIMPYEIEANGQKILLRLSGEIDLQLTPQIKQIATEAINSHPQAKQFCVDAPEVSYIDSSGIAVLVYLRRESEQKQLSFCWLGISQAIRTVIYLSGLSRLFDLPELNNHGSGS